MNKGAKIAFSVTILIIIILSCVIIFRPTPEIPTFDETPYRDSITILQKERDIYHAKYDSLDEAYTGLELQKQQIKIYYREKYKFIKGATTPELDSVIRFYW